jgi:hypothetical protein
MEKSQKIANKYFCEHCDYTCCNKFDYNKHLSTDKHNIATMAMEKSQKSQKILNKYVCESCDYKCCNKFDYNKHLSTTKHQNATISREKSQTDFKCDKCETTYKHYSSLWKHSKTCNASSVTHKLLAENRELRNFIMEQSKQHYQMLVEQSGEHYKAFSEQAGEHYKAFSEQAGEHCKTLAEQAEQHQKHTTEIVNKVLEVAKTSNNTITTTNSHNKAFNINLFLNEQCKDAINFSDFVNNIEVSRQDLENNAQLGFVDGVSKILIDSLNHMELNQRPIHCTDVKRETIYIKDDDKWNKSENNDKINKAIQSVTIKSIRTLLAWKAESPEYQDSDSDFSNHCIKMHMSSVAGADRDSYYPKVIKLVAKHVKLADDK